MEVRKEEVEEMFGGEITERDFDDALKCAKRKQKHIFSMKKSPVVMEHWYLVKLTEEYVRRNAFSRFTMDLCRTLRDMEKEHSASCQSAPTDTHIVAVPAL